MSATSYVKKCWGLGFIESKEVIIDYPIRYFLLKGPKVVRWGNGN